MLSKQDLYNIEWFTAHATPAPWDFSKADSTSINEHIAFVHDLLTRTEGDQLWYVSRAQEGKEPEDSPFVIAITGNGQGSEGNAQFITMARTVIPMLLEDLRAMRHLLPVLQMVYRKHVIDDDSIGLNEIEDKVQTALAEAMGDEDFQVWLKDVAKDDATLPSLDDVRGILKPEE